MTPREEDRLPVLAFDLAREADRLRCEPPWSQHGRNAVTLVKYFMRTRGFWCEAIEESTVLLTISWQGE